ncbi:MAG: hypothetical protein ACRDS9_10200 [Pseudonocardiaceae bacterium]
MSDPGAAVADEYFGEAQSRDLDAAAVVELATDFVEAARLLRAGLAETAMVRLLPLHLSEDELLVRVPLLVAAGVVVTALLGGTGVVQHLVMALCTDKSHVTNESLVDLMVDLVDVFAKLDRSPR